MSRWSAPFVFTWSQVGPTTSIDEVEFRVFRVRRSWFGRLCHWLRIGR